MNRFIIMWLSPTNLFLCWLLVSTSCLFRTLGWQWRFGGKFCCCPIWHPVYYFRHVMSLPRVGIPLSINSSRFQFGCLTNKVYPPYPCRYLIYFRSFEYVLKIKAKCSLYGGITHSFKLAKRTTYSRLRRWKLTNKMYPPYPCRYLLVLLVARTWECWGSQ